MSYIELLILSLGLAMDAFAVAIGIGLTVSRSRWRKALLVGLYFGVFQGVMPIIGYFAATFFAQYVTAFSHWISFGLLAFLGGKMIVGSLKREKCADRTCPSTTCTDRECPNEVKEVSLAPRTMFPLAVATSVDAMAIGVSFAFLYVSIAPAVGLIGAVTFVLSVAGVWIGGIFGTKFKNKAAFAGGVILVLMGINILIGGL